MSRRKRLRANAGVLLVLMAFGAFLLATQLRYIPLSEQEALEVAERVAWQAAARHCADEFENSHSFVEMESGRIQTVKVIFLSHGLEQGRVGLLIHPSVGFILPFGEFRLFDNPETTGFGCRGRSSTNR